MLRCRNQKRVMVMKRTVVRFVVQGQEQLMLMLDTVPSNLRHPQTVGPGFRDYVTVSAESDQDVAMLDALKFSSGWDATIIENDGGKQTSWPVSGCFFSRCSWVNNKSMHGLLVYHWLGGHT
jgi:hypothetical protein